LQPLNVWRFPPSPTIFHIHTTPRPTSSIPGGFVATGLVSLAQRSKQSRQITPDQGGGDFYFYFLRADINNNAITRARRKWCHSYALSPASERIQHNRCASSWNCIQEPRHVGQTKKPLPSPRLVSAALTTANDQSDASRTLAVMEWSQFIAHDMAYTPVRKMGKHPMSEHNNSQKSNFVKRLLHREKYSFSNRENVYLFVVSSVVSKVGKNRKKRKKSCFFGFFH
jgi:hypothetical protein